MAPQRENIALVIGPFRIQGRRYRIEAVCRTEIRPRERNGRKEDFVNLLFERQHCFVRLKPPIPKGNIPVKNRSENFQSPEAKSGYPPSVFDVGVTYTGLTQDLHTILADARRVAATSLSVAIR
jgi:hypothetical protein